jgi:glyoxylase-like metal-dependent hydrolase (beta-lactamase superfamily II)
LVINAQLAFRIDDAGCSIRFVQKLVQSMPRSSFLGVHQVLSGFVNAYLIETPEGLVLIDTGFPGSERKILKAMRGLGHAPHALKHIIATHAHPDHIGCLAALARATGAETWMHEIDAPVAESGEIRPVHLSSGLMAKLVYGVAYFVAMISGKVQPCRIDHRVKDGEQLPFGLVAIHAPGHCAGQIALLWPEKRILFAGDVCMDISGLRAPLMNEDAALAVLSFRRVTAYDFDVAFFGHGEPILKNAAEALRNAAL